MMNRAKPRQRRCVISTARERSRDICEISPRGARRNDKQTRFTFELEME